MITASTTLWRPVGSYELRLIAFANFTKFPPRLPEQPIFYPVLNEAYACDIAQRWNTGDPNSGFAGFVTRFEVPSVVAERYPRRVVGSRTHEELWVPAENLDAFCSSLVKPISVVRGWLGTQFPTVVEWDGPLGELGSDDLTAVVERITKG